MRGIAQCDVICDVSDAVSAEINCEDVRVCVYTAEKISISQERESG